MNTYEQEILELIRKRGFVDEFGQAIVSLLKGEYSQKRMLSYLRSGSSLKTQDIVDEAMAILSDVQQFKQKKINEHNQQKINEFYNQGLEKED